jgi:hypothetical protein
MNALAKFVAPAMFLLAASYSAASSAPAPTPSVTPTPTPTSGPIRCEFGKDECRALIRFALDRADDSAFEVECDGTDIYEDNFLIGRFGTKTLIQGITSLRNPTPPSILFEDGDGEADLFTSFGKLEGHCRIR